MTMNFQGKIENKLDKINKFISIKKIKILSHIR